MKSTSTLLAISCLAACMAVGSAASAESYDFNITGLSFNGSGTLDAVADPTLSGAYDVTNISGNINGVPITGLLPCTAYSPATPCNSSGLSVSFDNLLYPRGSGDPADPGFVDLDDLGIGFVLSSGIDGDIASNGSHTYAYTPGGTPSRSQPIDLSISPVPEPSGFLLLGTGLLALAGILRRARGAGSAATV